MNTRAIIEDESARDFLLRQIKLGRMQPTVWKVTSAIGLAGGHRCTFEIRKRRRLARLVVVAWCDGSDPRMVVSYWLAESKLSETPHYREEIILTGATWPSCVTAAKQLGAQRLRANGYFDP